MVSQNHFILFKAWTKPRAIITLSGCFYSWKQWEGSELPGGPKSANTAAECQGLCKANKDQGCVVFTFTPKKKCHLHTDDALKSLKTKKSYVAGFVDCDGK